MMSTRAVSLSTLSLLLLVSCVSQERHDESLQEARYYQRMYQDLEPMAGELEAEIAMLRGQLALYENEQPVEAVFTREVDDRLAELERIAAGLGTAPDDVSVLDIEGGYGFRLTDAVLFASGSADVTSEGNAVLAKLTADINTRPFLRVWVRGHTDDDPIVKQETLSKYPTNLHLSAARSLGVAADMIAAGIPGDKLVIAGFGPSEPVAANTNADGKRQNRRVEIFVIEEEPAAQDSK